ncbi:MAG: FAD-binding protein, partial [Shimia sp.]
MDLLDDLRALLGPTNVLTGPDAAPFSRDWTGAYAWTPRAVVRPADTAQVAAVVAACAAAGAPMVPLGGNTGLTGATRAEGAVMVSLARMTRLRALVPEAGTATVE